MLNDRYLRILPASGWVLHDPVDRLCAEGRWSERHLQCIWLDERLRPEGLRTLEGDRIVVLCPGRWNLESGPDFLDAVLRVGPGECMIRGDVEIHVRPADWDRHAHAADARYDRVALHVTYYPGPVATLPVSVRQVSLAAALRCRPEFSFDDIDLEAYPHAVIPREPRPCARALEGDPDRIEALLSLAGAYRLDLKTRRIAGELKTGQDRYQLFYEEILAGLGYKGNSASLRQVARRLPLTRLDAMPEVEDRYAALLGVAGLLPLPDRCRTPEGGAFARRLWDRFWRMDDCAATGTIEWRLAGCRPLNHPRRRLAAAATLFAESHDVLDRITALPLDAPANWLAATQRLFEGPCAVPHWRRRIGFDLAEDRREYALIGRERIAALLINAVVPLMRAENRWPASWLAELPAESISTPVREMAHRLLGHDLARTAWARRGLHLQGLVQLYRDFCLGSRLGCVDCPLPDRMASRPDALSG